MLVVIHHSIILEDLTPLDAAVKRLASYGWCGVDLFFVLSGFLITGILYDAKRTPNYFRNFYARRALRIFPLYYGFLLLVFVILPPVLAAHPDASAREQVYFWLYLANVAIAQRFMDGGFFAPYLVVFWSLAVEEHFYLLWPVLVYLLSRKQTIVACVALIVIAIALRAILVLFQTDPLIIFVLTPTRFDALAVGSLLALLLRSPLSLPTLAQRLVRPCQILIPVCALLLVPFIIQDERIGQGIPSILIYTVVSLLCGSLVVLTILASRQTLLARLFSALPLVILGRYSYAIYVFHMAINYPIRKLAIYEPRSWPTLLDSQLPAQCLHWLVMVLLSTGAAVVSWHLYEKHFLKLKRLFPLD